MKVLALFGFLTIVMGAVFHLHVVFLTSESIEDLADALSSAGAAIESIVKMATFYFMRKTYKILFNSILRISKRR